MITFEPGEYIVAEVQKHWWRIFTWGFWLSIMAIAPVIIVAVLDKFVSGFPLEKFADFAGFLYTVWLAMLWVVFFVEWTDYYLDIWIITNHRIIDIEQQGLFSRSIATVRLSDIQDISVDSIGIIATILKFGDITIQTAGAQNEFYIFTAKNFEKAKETIYRLVSEAKGVMKK